jgi:hypothetical protein
MCVTHKYTFKCCHFTYRDGSCEDPQWCFIGKPIENHTIFQDCPSCLAAKSTDKQSETLVAEEDLEATYSQTAHMTCGEHSREAIKKVLAEFDLAGNQELQSALEEMVASLMH